MLHFEVAPKIITAINLFCTSLWLVLFSILYSWSVRPYSLYRISHNLKQAFNKCGLVRVISYLFLLLFILHITTLTGLIKDDSLNDLLSYHFTPYATSITLLSSLFFLLSSIFVGFPEFIIPQIDTHLLKRGIYGRTRNP